MNIIHDPKTIGSWTIKKSVSDKMAMIIAYHNDRKEFVIECFPNGDKADQFVNQLTINKP